MFATVCDAVYPSGETSQSFPRTMRSARRSAPRLERLPRFAFLTLHDRTKKFTTGVRQLVSAEIPRQGWNRRPPILQLWGLLRATSSVSTLSHSVLLPGFEIHGLTRPKFGTRIAFPGCAKRNGMLRISVIDSQTERRLVLAGKLVAPWVVELRTAWKAAIGEIEGRALVVDLGNVTVISQEGENALSECMSEGAKFRPSTVLTRHVMKQLARKNQQGSPRR